MPHLQSRVGQLYRDLESLGQGAGASQQVLLIYNALLGLAKQQASDDPILSEMRELRETVQVGTLRVLVGQIQAALAA